MIRSIDLRGAARHQVPDQAALLPRAAMDVDAALGAATAICADVREHGEAAVLAASRRFDRIDDPLLAVPAEAMEQAHAQLDPDVRAALEESIRRLRHSCEAERPADVTTRFAPGGTVVRRRVPGSRVGLYVR